MKNCCIAVQNPKSKLQNPAKKVCILDGILDFGFPLWGFWILDFGVAQKMHR